MAASSLQPPELVLASGSSARRGMLAAAGVVFRVVPADIDEDAVRAGMPGAEPRDVARALARLKAEEVSRREPTSLVIGADQVLAVGDLIHTKPAGIDEARAALRSLAGREHCLHSAVALAHAGVQVWADLDSATLVMRDVSDAFLDHYLDRVGERVCASVGAYELEGRGIQLFERIRGDYFTILGMPLLPLLAELRARGVLAH